MTFKYTIGIVCIIILTVGCADTNEQTVSDLYILKYVNSESALWFLLAGIVCIVLGARNRRKDQ
jgi:hypothetical protein